MPTRREFVQTVTLLAGATLLPVSTVLARVQDGSLEVARLRDGVWLITEGGGNSLLLATTDGPVLIDTKVSASAFDLLDAVKSANAPPTLVINTHHHADHTGGNYAFSESAKIIAQKKLKPRLQATLDDKIRPGLIGRAKELSSGGKMAKAYALEQKAKSLAVAAFAPQIEVDDSLDHTHGGLTMHLRHFGAGHTDNDLVISLPELNILHAGDLVFRRLHPFIDRSAKATTRGWQTSLAAIENLCDDATIVVPGHGELTNQAGVREQRLYFDKTRAAVAAATKSGKTREAVMDLEIAEFAPYGFERLRSRALEAIYDELNEER